MTVWKAIKIVFFHRSRTSIDKYGAATVVEACQKIQARVVPTIAAIGIFFLLIALLCQILIFLAKSA